MNLRILVEWKNYDIQICLPHSLVENNIRWKKRSRLFRQYKMRNQMEIFFKLTFAKNF